jgi:phosphotransferase system HPr (HPr) family protein
MALRAAGRRILYSSPPFGPFRDTWPVAEVTVVVRNPSGLHARPAALFVKAAGRLSTPVSVTNLSRDPSRSASARSLLAVLGLGVSSGHEIRIAAEGEGAEASVDALRQLVEEGLGETLGP